MGVIPKNIGDSVKLHRQVAKAIAEGNEQLAQDTMYEHIDFHKAGDGLNQLCLCKISNNVWIS